MRRLVLIAAVFGFGLAAGWAIRSPGRKQDASRTHVSIDRPIGGGWERELIRLRVVRMTGPEGDTDYKPGNDRPAWVIVVPGRTYYAVAE